MRRTLVVAKHHEDVSWLAQIPADWGKVIVYDKGLGELPNWPGREAHTYLHHIVSQYDILDGEIVFAQGRPFDHCPGFMENLINDEVKVYGWSEICTTRDGQPHISGLPMDDYVKAMGLQPPIEYRFVCGAQFRVSAEQIKKHGKLFYENLLFASKAEPRIAYLLERVWQVIFGFDVVNQNGGQYH